MYLIVPNLRPLFVSSQYLQESGKYTDCCFFVQISRARCVIFVQDDFWYVYMHETFFIFHAQALKLIMHPT